MKEKLENALHTLENEPSESGKAKIKKWMIEKRFAYCDFYMIPQTWLIHHDDKFETIKKQIDKNRVTFRGRPAPLIATTKNLQLNFLNP